MRSTLKKSKNKSQKAKLNHKFSLSENVFVQKSLFYHLLAKTKPSTL